MDEIVIDTTLPDQVVISRGEQVVRVLFGPARAVDRPPEPHTHTATKQQPRRVPVAPTDFFKSMMARLCTEEEVEGVETAPKRPITRSSEWMTSCFNVGRSMPVNASWCSRIIRSNSKLSEYIAPSRTSKQRAYVIQPSAFVEYFSNGRDGMT